MEKMGVAEELAEPKELAVLQAVGQAGPQAALYGFVHLSGQPAGSEEADNAALRTQVTSLKDQLTQHSDSSHKPPSSDGFRQPRRTRYPSPLTISCEMAPVAGSRWKL